MCFVLELVVSLLCVSQLTAFEIKIVYEYPLGSKERNAETSPKTLDFEVLSSGSKEDCILYLNEDMQTTKSSHGVLMCVRDNIRLGRDGLPGEEIKIIFPSTGPLQPPKVAIPNGVIKCAFLYIVADKLKSRDRNIILGITTTTVIASHPKLTKECEGRFVMDGEGRMLLQLEVFNGTNQDYKIFNFTEQGSNLRIWDPSERVLNAGPRKSEPGAPKVRVLRAPAGSIPVHLLSNGSEAKVPYDQLIWDEDIADVDANLLTESQSVT